MINQKKYSWENLTVQMEHGELVDITAVDYDDERDMEALYGKGSKPVGYGCGNKKGSGKLTLRREEFLRMQANAGTSIYDMKPFPIVLNYAMDGQDIQTDVLEQCIFTKRKAGGKQGDKDTSVELDFTILGGIKINGQEQWGDNV